jgi:alpha/beta superfamily hydrolase
MVAGRRTLEVADGARLEAEVDVPDGAVAVAVLAHPHPLYGGSMDAGLVDELFQRLPRRVEGAAVGALRFNFRGVGASTGRHDEGRAERLDVAAALDAARELAAPLGVPCFLCGWSFGADVSLAVADTGHQGWVAIAAPLRIVAAEELVAPHDPRPKLLLVPEHDQFRPPASAAEATSAWTATTLVTLPGGDHFLWGHGRQVADHVASFAAGLAG